MSFDQLKKHSLFSLVVATALFATAIAPARTPDNTVQNNPTGVAKEDEAAVWQQLDNVTAQNPRILATIAHRTGRKVKAQFKYGRALAKLEHAERYLETYRLEVSEREQAAKTSRAAALKELNAEMERTREQFKDGQTNRDKELIGLIQAYRPNLKRQKEIENQCSRIAVVLDARLGEIRNAISRIRTRIKKEELEPIAGPLIGDDIGADIDPLPLFGNSDDADESLDEALRSLEEFE